MMESKNCGVQILNSNFFIKLGRQSGKTYMHLDMMIGYMEMKFDHPNLTFEDYVKNHFKIGMKLIKIDDNESNDVKGLGL